MTRSIRCHGVSKILSHFFMFLLTLSLQESIQGCFLPRQTQGNGLFVWYYIPVPMLSSQGAIHFRQRLGSCSWFINRGYSLHPLKILAQWILEVKSPLFLWPSNPNLTNLLFAQIRCYHQQTCMYYFRFFCCFFPLRPSCYNEKPIFRLSPRSIRVYSPGEQKICCLDDTIWFIKCTTLLVVSVPWLL